MVGNTSSIKCNLGLLAAISCSALLRSLRFEVVGHVRLIQSPKFFRSPARARAVGVGLSLRRAAASEYSPTRKSNVDTYHDFATKPNSRLLQRQVMPRRLHFDRTRYCRPCLVLIDIEERCQYHNRAFMNRICTLRPEQHPWPALARSTRCPDLPGNTCPQSVSLWMDKPVHYERTQKMPDGATCKLSFEHIPTISEHGKVPDSIC